MKLKLGLMNQDLAIQIQPQWDKSVKNLLKMDKTSASFIKEFDHVAW